MITFHRQSRGHISRKIFVTPDNSNRYRRMSRHTVWESFYRARIVISLSVFFFKGQVTKFQSVSQRFCYQLAREYKYNGSNYQSARNRTTGPCSIGIPLLLRSYSGPCHAQTLRWIKSRLNWKSILPTYVKRISLIIIIFHVRHTK